MSTFWALMVEQWQPAISRACLHGSAAVLLATAVESAWRRMPANLRSWMWRLVFVKIALALVCGATIPLPILPAKSAAFSSSAPPPTVSGVAIATPAVASRTPAGPSMAPATPLSDRSSTARAGWRDWGLGVWLVGVAGCGVVLSRGGRHARRQRAEGTPIEHPSVQRLLASLCERFALPRPPRLKLLRGGGSPCVLGGRRPTILLPHAWLATCNAEQLRLAIAHELAHVARRDLRWNQLTTVCRMALFFHPLVWWAARRYAAAQELACDELALRRTGGSPAVLARMLLQFVERPAAREWAGAAAMIGASSTLRERIVAMQRLFTSPSPSATLAAAFFAAGILLLAPFSLAEQRATIASPSDPPRTESAQKPKKNGASASASASAQALGIAGGSAGGGGTGSGNAGGVARSRASVTAKASTSEDDKEQRPAKTAIPSASQDAQPAKKSVVRSISKMQQKMTATSDGDGEKWTRTTEAHEDGRDIKIEESAERIRISVTDKGRGKEAVTVAKNAKELQARNPAAYEVYRKYADGDSSKPPVIEGGKAFGDAFGKAFGDAGGGAFGGADANQLLKKQIRELRDSADVRGTPLEGLLKDLEDQVEDRK